MAESYIVKIIKDGVPAKPGEIGEIVTTDSNNYSVPLIRYRIADLAISLNKNETCSCGRGLPRIVKVSSNCGWSKRYMDAKLIFLYCFKDMVQ
jgi:phenylacetate-CoA ligase